MRKILSFIVIASLFASGCISQIASIGDYTKHWIGHSIEEKKATTSRPESYASRIGWKENTYTLDNGNWVYVEPDSKNCFIHWKVNPHGIIFGYNLELKCY